MRKVTNGPASESLAPLQRSRVSHRGFALRQSVLDGKVPVRRPLAVTLPAAFLLAAPLLQLGAVCLGVTFLGFGEPKPRAHMIYGIAAPVVGWLLWRMHPRARFAFYIFASCELIRFWLSGRVHWEVPLLYAGLIALLYTAPARAVLPLIQATGRPRAFARPGQESRHS